MKDKNISLVSHDVYIYGMNESTVRENIIGLQNTEIFSVEDDKIQIKILAESENLCLDIIEKVKEKLGSFVYGVDIKEMEEVVVKELLKQGKTIATAESCTGGLVAKRITDIGGSSQVFETGVVTYANKTKTKLLGVSEDILSKHGAVSEECARAMAEGLIKLSGADIAIATTGIAGPGGGTATKPVGLVYMALSDGKSTYVCHKTPFHEEKPREWHRLISSTHVLDMARRYLQGKNTFEV